LSFAPGETQKTVTVTVTGDTTYEPNETFAVNLSAPTNAVLGTAQGLGTIQNDDLAPDSYEVNNTVGAASNLGKTSNVTVNSLTLNTSADLDYFRFTAPKAGSFRVSINPTQGSGTLNLTLLNSQQVVLASGQSESAGVILVVSLSASQQCYVKVNSANGGLFAYSMSIVKRTGGALMLGTSAAGNIAETTAAQPVQKSGNVATLSPVWLSADDGNQAEWSWPMVPLDSRPDDLWVNWPVEQF